MTDISAKFLSEEELQKLCSSEGFFPPLADFDSSDVPEDLRALVPYVEIWGHKFEDDRRSIRDTTPAKIVSHLWRLRLETELHDLLDSWLAGPVAVNPPYSSAYVAFSCFNQTLGELGDPTDGAVKYH